MISRDIWKDKLPEDKAKYYNRTRMSLTMFCRKMYVGEMQLLDEMRRGGYWYNKPKRMFEKRTSITRTIR